MRAANPSQALAVTLVDELARCGVRHACLAPGSRSTPLALALAEEPRIQLHVRIDERSASFLALGIAKATGTPAVVLTTSGTAAANLFPAIVEADLSHTPLVVLTADRPPELRATGANQTIDQIKLYGDSVRWFCEIGAPEEIEGAPRYWRSVGARAVATSLGTPKGPVHLNVAFREPLTPQENGWSDALDGRADDRPWHEVVRHPRDPGPELIADLADRVGKCERGVIVAGDGATGQATAALAEAVGYPLIAEPTSGLRFGPAAISTYDALLRCPRFATAYGPELVIRVGKPGTSKVLGPWLESAAQILIDDGAGALDPDRSIQVVIDADVDRTAEALLKAAPERTDSAWIEIWRRAEKLAREAMDRVIEERDEPTEPRTARDTARCMSPGSTLVVASSMPVRDLDWFMEPLPDVAVIGNRGASGIDGFVSTAIGVAVGTQGPVTALAGDLSMLHDSNGLGVTTGPTPDVTFVVVNNDGGGIFSFLAQATHTRHFEELFGTPHGLSFARLADVYGCGHMLVEAAEELPRAIETARSEGGIQLVEVQTDRIANVEIHKEIWDAVEAAIEDLVE